MASIIQNPTPKKGFDLVPYYGFEDELRKWQSEVFQRILHVVTKNWDWKNLSNEQRTAILEDCSTAADKIVLPLVNQKFLGSICYIHDCFEPAKDKYHITYQDGRIELKHLCETHGWDLLADPEIDDFKEV